MELITYLHGYFYTKQQLLEMTQTSEDELEQYQAAGMMPQPSYRITLDITCDSFFGKHQENNEQTYYAKGYATWLHGLRSLSNEKEAFQVFSNHYRDVLDGLKGMGHDTSHPKLSSSLSEHLAEEWKHFIDGTYGLCTKSGLAEDIATKELAITEITSFLEKTHLTGPEKQQLKRAVDLLDHASALFAPHERDQSSRKRLVDDVRDKYHF